MGALKLELQTFVCGRFCSPNAFFIVFPMRVQRPNRALGPDIGTGCGPRVNADQFGLGLIHSWPHSAKQRKAGLFLSRSSKGVELCGSFRRPKSIAAPVATPFGAWRFKLTRLRDDCPVPKFCAGDETHR
jgi:hypothetical protein